MGLEHEHTELERAAGNPPEREEYTYRLSDFAPQDLEIEFHNGCTYYLSADPAISMVANMLQIEEAITDGTHKEAARAVVEGQAVIYKLISENPRNVDLPAEPPMGVGDLLNLFGLITGGTSVAQAVAAAMRDPDAPRTPKRGERPLPSPKRSRSRS